MLFHQVDAIINLGMPASIDVQVSGMNMEAVSHLTGDVERSLVWPWRY